MAELIFKDTDSISEINHMVGFNSQVYFARGFQQSFNSYSPNIKTAFTPLVQHLFKEMQQ